MSLATVACVYQGGTGFDDEDGPPSDGADGPFQTGGSPSSGGASTGGVSSGGRSAGGASPGVGGATGGEPSDGAGGGIVGSTGGSASGGASPSSGGGPGSGGLGGAGGSPPACSENSCINGDTLNFCSGGSLGPLECESACLEAGYDFTTGCGYSDTEGDELCLCDYCDDPCSCNVYASGYACGGNLAPSADPDRLYFCNESATVDSVVCPSGCHAGGLGEPDYCEGSESNPCMNLPFNDVACGANLAVPLTGLDAETLFTCQDQQTVGELYCLNGCYAAPFGSPDSCQ